MIRFIIALVFIGFASGFAQMTSGCQADTVPISEIQGLERRSAYAGELVTVQGVISSSFFAEDSLGGFFLQDPLGDANPLTSDALFVKLDPSKFEQKLLPGDRVQVKGKVLERNELTQLDRLESLELCGYYGLLEPTLAEFPTESLSDWERYEGMLVTFAQPLSASEVYDLGHYGQVLLSAEGRLYHPNNGQENSQNNALRQLLLDDASKIENPDPIPYLLPDESLRLGDTVLPEGVIVNYGLDAYKLEPTQLPLFERQNLRTAAPDEVGGRLKVASFNVLNYFTSLSERGSDTAEEFERQEAKLVAALAAIRADVFGLIEIENNGERALGQLVSALNNYLGAELYTFSPDPPGGTGTDQIHQAFIYRADKVKLVSISSDKAAIHDRPPVAGVFQELVSEEMFTVIVAHFKSKGSCPAAGDTDKGQGCWTLRRGAQAEASLEFATRLVEASGDEDVLIIGDLNSYRLEDPVTLLSQSFINLDERLPLNERYSYVYFGEAGTLDYAFASPSLNEQVTGFTIWHINSDESRILDYNLEYNPPELFRASPYRSSDHDPVVIGLDLN
ncbi:MAG: ExeM/NucH family extracellular endonuclease [Trueperaceae bacterium]|nr:ExeM/NucH family extracellular endonuclease [Trueperaceae bacterium]